MRAFAAASLIPLLALTSACAPRAAPVLAPEVARATDTPIVSWVVTLAPPASATATAGPFVLELTPLPTATPLATLVLPPSPSVPLDVQVWDGLPTYPAESWPDFYFRLRYAAPDWALMEDQFGYPALVSRRQSGCLITPSVGRGLPLSGRVDHEVRIVGDITYQISRATVGATAQFVNYAGGDARIFTAFEVRFQDSPEACLLAAEAVLGTLRSVAAGEATPVTP